MYYIAKKTEKIRYKFVSYLMKKLTPVLYKKIDMQGFFTNRVFQLTIDTIPATIRPSTKFMKEYFKGKLVKGAEIGVERGKNSESLLKELNIEKIYLIDVWDVYEGIDHIWSKENYNYVLRKFKNDKRVKVIKDYSENVIENIEDNSLDFIYIDANHDYDYVLQDIELWFPKLKKYGILAGHDIMLKKNDSYQVLEAVKDFCIYNNIYFWIKEPDWYVVKKDLEFDNVLNQKQLTLEVYNK